MGKSKAEKLAEKAKKKAEAEAKKNAGAPDQDKPEEDSPADDAPAKKGKFKFRNKDGSSYQTQVHLNNKPRTIKCVKGVIETSDAELATHLRKVYPEIN